MDQSRKHDAFRHIIATCEDLHTLAVELEHKLIATMLEMIVMQARQAQAGDGALDGH